MKIIKVEYDEEVHGQERDWIERKHDIYVSDRVLDKITLRKKYENFKNVKITLTNEWRLMKVDGYLYPIKRD